MTSGSYPLKHHMLSNFIEQQVFDTELSCDSGAMTLKKRSYKQTILSVNDGIRWNGI